MKLVIDIGNSKAKLALFDSTALVSRRSITKLSVAGIKKFVGKKKVERVLLASVKEINSSIVSYLKNNYHVIIFSSKTDLPVKNKYKTPATLGYDRIASVVAAVNIYPGTNALVIDMGSCITYNFINSRKEYLGGSISPGLDMRFKAMHNFTDKLPLVKISPGSHKARTFAGKIIGSSTKESMEQGVLAGIIGELNSVIGQYGKKYKGLKVIITGGDAALFESNIKSKIFAVPNLVLQGLNIILDHNAIKRKP
ncbi:MAG: type III pantothenate kinase [Bacteroidetes bacterium]|nr:type III pantothenate kinase [Bacteroidota bacterium]